MITIGIVDDHQLFVKSLSLMLESFTGYNVVVEASNGKDLIDKITQKNSIPEIMLLDVNMPKMNGVETATWLNKQYPTMKLVALSSNDSDHIIIDMIKAGCCAYLMKVTHPNELEKALNDIYTKGFYNGDASNINFRRLIMSEKEKELLNISDKEKQFLKLTCSDMTYKQIAAAMFVSERTVDGYRETLFQKLNVQSRVGLCLEAIRKHIVDL